MKITKHLRSISLVLCYLFAITFTVPNFIDHGSLKHFQRMNLGLDLRGGSQLLLSYDVSTYIAELYTSMSNALKKDLRKNKIGYVDFVNKKDGIYFNIREKEDQDKVKSAVRKFSRAFTFEIHDKSVKLYFNEEELTRIKSNLAEQSVEIIRRRVDETGTTEPIIQPRGNNMIDLQVPGLSSPEHLKKLLGKTAKLSFHTVDEIASEAYVVSKVIPSDSFLAMDEDGKHPIVLKRDVVITGNDLTDARVGFDYGSPIVSFAFNNTAARIFAEFTKASVGKRFAIVMDGKVISAPVVREPITSGSGMIQGHFTTDTANELALLLRAGALPVELKIEEERTVGPSLGQDSIQAGKISAVVALILVSIFMVWTYGVLGMFANFSLIMNLSLTIAILSIANATLTMPGIAAMVLTIGMAVDANVLIFERIREEVHNKHTLVTSVVLGFKNAFSAIFDSNLTTVIVALMLYSFGSGPVKGFAVSLTIGTLSSMLSNIVLTKVLILSWIEKFKIKQVSI